MQAGAVESNVNKTGTGIGSVVAGGLVGRFSPTIAASVLSTPFALKMLQLSKLTDDEFNAISHAMPNVLEKSGLAKKGCGIIRATADNLSEIKNILLDEVRNNAIFKFMPKFVQEAEAIKTLREVDKGFNAFCAFKNKKIIMPEKTLALAFFHEAGHAMNSTMSTLGKTLQKCRSLAFLTLPILLVSLLKGKKSEGEQAKGFWDKTTTFIKNNAGKLSFMTMIPIILEEGLASMKGNKLAKQFLNPELAKKVAQSNRYGFITYLILAATTGIGIHLGIKLKDKLMQQKNTEKAAA